MSDDHVHDSRIMQAVSVGEKKAEEQSSEEVARLKRELKKTQEGRDSSDILNFIFGIVALIAAIVTTAFGISYSDKSDEVEGLRNYSSKMLDERNKFSVLSRHLKLKLDQHVLREAQQSASRYTAKEILENHNSSNSGPANHKTPGTRDIQQVLSDDELKWAILDRLNANPDARWDRETVKAIMESEIQANLDAKKKFAQEWVKSWFSRESIAPALIRISVNAEIEGQTIFGPISGPVKYEQSGCLIKWRRKVYILTSGYLTKDITKFITLTGKFGDNVQQELEIVGSENVNYVTDIAILKFKDPKFRYEGPTFRLDEGARSECGDGVRCVNAFGGLDAVLGGLIAKKGYYEDTERQVIYYECPVIPGGNGGVLLNRDNEFIGLATAYYPNGLSFAISVKSILPAIKKMTKK